MGFLTTIAPAEQYIYRTKINKQSETPSEFYIYCIGIYILFKRVCGKCNRKACGGNTIGKPTPTPLPGGEF